MKLDEAELAANLAYGARLRFYRFDKYKTKEKPEQKPSLKHFTVLVGGCRPTRSSAFDPMDKIGDARELHPRPGLRAGQRHLSGDAGGGSEEADRARRRGGGAGRHGDDEARHGRAARRRPGQRPRKPARDHAVERRGGKEKPIAFVGKGVTFDTGGISIKPAAGMEDMKWDMAGSAAVIGLMHALAAPQGQGQRGRHRRPGGEHAVGQRAAAGRHRHLDVGPDHRGDQHRRRRPPRAGRRALVLPGDASSRRS